jgi:starvation-inducible DNA-binding protein
MFPSPPASARRGPSFRACLVDLLDLALIGKQAHWNVQGRHFRSLHGELDELVDSWHALADVVAERAVSLGAAPDGQAETIAGSSQIEPLPGGHLDGADVVALMGDRLAEVIARVRERMERIAAVDPVSEHVLVDVAATLEKQLWMLRAQRGGLLTWDDRSSPAR